MKLLNRKSLCKLPLILLAVAGMTGAALADNNGRGNDNGKGNANANSAGAPGKLVRNGPAAIKGNIWTRRHVYYVGDELDIRVQFPRGHELLESGEVDAHVVVFAAAGSVSAVPVPSDVDDQPRQFYRVDSVTTETLPEGQYQLGLVVTVPGGDATALADWYGGFRGLLDSEAIYLAQEPIDGDSDGDGEMDDDEDGDGLAGEEADETDDDSPSQD